MPSKQMTVDHYYLPLDRQPRYLPRKERGDVDYDHIESMDISLVNEHISSVIKGELVNTPVYNMKSGYRDPPGKPFQLPERGILVIEGIHALNPSYTR
jgi:uridine kinase